MADIEGQEPDPGGRPPHEPTPATREQVKAWAVVGVAQEVMARQLEIDPKTLRKHYRDELDMSLAMANATIAGVLFKKAQAGDTASVFFWLKTQAGWRETNKVVHSNDPDHPMPAAETTIINQTMTAKEAAESYAATLNDSEG
jgi:hypothetical protein